jgi:hypothetical protein
VRQRAPPLPFTLQVMTDAHAAANAEQLRLLREALEEVLGQAVAPVLETAAAVACGPDGASPGDTTTSDQAAPAASEVH